MKKNIYLITIICLCIFVTTGCKKKKPPENPVFPSISSIRSTVINNVAFISWHKPETANPIRYKLYRNDVLIQSLTDTTFYETLNEAGAYNYCVSAVYSKGESEKTCIVAIVTNISSEDYAFLVEGSYVGDIATPLSSDTIKDVVVELNYPSENNVNFYINDTISAQGVVVPLNFDENVLISYDAEKDVYTFSFSTTTTVEAMGMVLTLPITCEGSVTKDSIQKLILDIVIQTGIIGDVPATYIGFKQLPISTGKTPSRSSGYLINRF